MKVELKLPPNLPKSAFTALDAGRVLPGVARAIGQAAQEVLGRAVKGRFTGKGPFPVSQNKLGVRTNRLRKSLRATAPQMAADGGMLTVAMGSNVQYFRGHELGFRGRVNVRGHTRRAVKGKVHRGKLTKATLKRQRGRFAAGRAGRAGYQFVRPHKRKVDLPARAPLGTELRAITTRAKFYAAIKGVIARLLKL